MNLADFYPERLFQAIHLLSVCYCVDLYGIVLCIIIIFIKVSKNIPVSIRGDSLCLNNMLKTLKHKYYFKLNKDFGFSFFWIIQ